MTTARDLLGAAALIATAAAAVAPAHAQSAHKRQAGVIGGAPSENRTERIETCELPAGLSEDEIDARTEEHWDRGHILYAQGDFDGAIDEFVAAYCHGRYASILFDIGQAYERLVDYERAVAYWDRYVVDAPEDERAKRDMVAYRVETLRRLPARIKVATLPPGATVTLTGPTGVAAEDRANENEPIEVRRGLYSMRIELAGYEPIVREVSAEIGQPYSYYFRLEPLRGRVRISASPATARIFVDDKLVGIGNYSDNLPIGTYRVTVEGAGRATVTRAAEVQADRPTDLSIELPDKPRSGRRELLVASTLGGGIFGGTAFTTVFGQDTTGASLGGTLGLGVGFAGAYFGADDDVSVGTSSYLIGATLIGAGEGALIASWACRNDRCDTDDVVPGVALASGIAGLGFAAATADRFDLSAGDAALINSGAMWGTTAGALFWAVFDQDDRVGEPLVFVGLNAGIAAGAAAAARTDYTRGHVALIDLSGLAGLVAGVALAGAFPEKDSTDEDGESERVVHFALGGMTVGLISGAYFLRNRSEPKSPGNLKLAPTVSAAKDETGASVPTFGAIGVF